MHESINVIDEIKGLLNEEKPDFKHVLDLALE